jgi:uncharacterized OB-fold protein
VTAIFPEGLYRHGVLRTTKAWRQRVERYRLVGSKCLSCETLWWPGRKVCGKCNSRKMENYQFSHRGELVTNHHGQLAWYVPPVQGYEVYGDTRILAVIKLPEGVHVGGTELIDYPPEKVRDGMKVRMVLRKLRREQNGNWQYGFMWAPDESEG